MKQQNGRDWKTPLLSGLVTALAGPVIYPALDALACRILTRAPFVYSVEEHLIYPLILGFVLGAILRIPLGGKKKD